MYMHSQSLIVVHYVTIIGDIITEGQQNQRKKKRTKNSKEFITDGSASSSSPSSVTAEITDSTMSPCHSDIVSVTDDDNNKITERIRQLRKRSLPSINSTNMLLEQDGSRLADGVMYVCILVCVCVSVYVCMRTHVHVCMYVCVCVVRACMCAHGCMYMYINVCLCVRRYVYVHVQGRRKQFESAEAISK